MTGRQGLVRSGGLALLLASVVLAAGCSDNKSSRGSTAAAIGSGGLGIASSTPQDGEQDFPPADSLFVTLTQDVDSQSLLTGALELRTDVGIQPVQLSLVTPRVVEARPLAPLEANKAHILRVSTQLASTSGERLPADAIIQFTTGMARVPVVPLGGGTGVIGDYRAGVAAVDITPPIGVPLAGFGGGGRRHSPLPDLNPFNEHTFLNPSVGKRDPIFAKALVLGNGGDSFCLVTLDTVATDAEVVALAWQKASAQGFSLPLEKVMFCSSHTHSGPGAVTKRLFWQFSALDLYVDRVAQQLAAGIAQAMVAAERNLGPAVVGVANTLVTNATENRRHGDSPQLQKDSIDPEMIVIRVDRPDGTPVATVWNFAMHGTKFGSGNLEFSADMMGSASLKFEAQVGGVSLFVNGAEGDLRPIGSYDATGQILADAMATARQAAVTRRQGLLVSVHAQVDLGALLLDWSPQRNGQGTTIAQQGWVQALAGLGIQPGITLTMPNGWVEQEFRFQAVRIDDTVLSSLPGEPIHELGLILKQDGHNMGFTHVIPACLANGYGSYFTTETEYWYGGYEGLASFFGPDNGKKLLDAARSQMRRVR